MQYFQTATHAGPIEHIEKVRGPQTILNCNLFMCLPAWGSCLGVWKTLETVYVSRLY